ncbi:hypothetical protein H8E88_16660 [candidate division KSB1 bacterium]|nr:hypothetical protein [candidate division KSB1 bacterium]
MKEKLINTIDKARAIKETISFSKRYKFKDFENYRILKIEVIPGNLDYAMRGIVKVEINTVKEKIIYEKFIADHGHTIEFAKEIIRKLKRDFSHLSI